MPIPFTDVRRTHFVEPKRADGQATCFAGNIGPFVNGEHLVRPRLVHEEDECLELRVFVSP